MLKLSTRGDTIVEVLIALAILGFALTTSYSIMNQSLVTARNAQEHSEALEYLNSQVELVRAASSQPVLFTQATPFCMLGTVIKPATDPVCLVGMESRYAMDIERTTTKVYGEDQPIFTFSIKWDGPGSKGPQSEVLSYKIYRSEP